MALDHAAIAEQTLAAIDASAPLGPWSLLHHDIGSDDAYAVAMAMRDKRLARGESVVGRKIGFTNKATWDQLGIDAAVWAPVYDTTLDAIGDEPVTLSAFHEPRIEPEIVVGLDGNVPADADIATVEQCIAWVAFGFEIVQSVYPDWSFSTTDAVINQGMHGRLLVGDRVAIAQGQRKGLADILSTLEIELTCNGQHIAYGSGHAVLGGPVHAVAHLSAIAGADTLRAGETITTGTLTPVLAVQPGDSWAIVARTNPLGLNAPTVKLEAEA